ncbi:sodium/calcium exchanger protein-like protein [Bimuria novae-zelandiae CBS 107.79]|uniref:Sodium/calcium exchanger protein-like protein n=1 Tax=Bimuria novae-zelandiae CBS 107.79 TaxID=1447943 RepID=A0A6A5UM84_9PLEO|nr:sodium/calcium exchanger protein-like protein [Bimuria novae-zelandiae CBS 107.79]
MSLLNAPQHSTMRRRARYSARPFALTILAVLVLVLLAWVKSENGYAVDSDLARSARLSKRDFLIQDEDCRLVHHAKDKCAFIRENCPDEEAGIFSYLSLYYCRLPHAKPFAFVILVLWLALLFSTIGIAASDFFCVNLSTIANLLGMSESMAGVTFLAFGNGSPDVFSTFAAFNTNSASLAIGELIGAAGFITAVVAGSMALVRPFKVARRSFVRDVSFFIVAATFSMVFIWDGKLTLWESCTMVGFYIFYVCFVMAWHWWLGRRKARQLRAAAMRSHFVVPGGEEEEIPQDYHDEEDAPASAGRPSLMRGVSADDFAALERDDPGQSLEADENEEMRERWLGELNHNMRVSRPPVGLRRNTHTPIRPSLVGALEFRAVLSSLQKSRNIQTLPINLRRYSDDPTFTTAQQQDLISTASDPAPRPPYEVEQGPSEHTPLVTRPTQDVQRHLPNRLRAVSANDVDNARLDPDTLRSGAIPTIDFGPSSPKNTRGQTTTGHNRPISPVISLSPPPSEHGSTAASPVIPTLHPNPTPNMLAPPTWDGSGSSLRSATTSPSPRSSPVVEPTSSSRPQPKLVLPEPASPTIPFPAFTDYPTSAHSSRAPSCRLPPPSASAASLSSDYFADHIMERSDRAKVPRWWPSSVLPPPIILLSTLFPTLANWKDKNIWDKMLGVVAAPSVFLLTITLPVVESQKEDDDDAIPTSVTSLSLPDAMTPVSGSLSAHQRSRENTSSELPRDPSTAVVGKADRNGRPNSVVTTSTHPAHQVTITTEDNMMQSPEQLPAAPPSSGPTTWNRWLVIIQTFTAPFFIIFIVWANTELEYPRALIRPTMFSLLVSLCTLAFLLITTTPTRPPRWRSALCFLGFAVSIAWISSIANEVVGVLKTLGVILNMSEAILGLTIFAVGNSLGDFVADITVARLGFPVMALSACFGGPMLNILLGIGLSGCWIILKGGRHRHEKHPDRPIKFKPYQIDISTTLVISGASLLVTLVGLLIVVPWRRWKMDKMIGWGLVALWCVSTVVNVVVEVLGITTSVS